MTNIDKIAVTERLLIALDFDGTLAPIAPRADLAWILPSAENALIRLNKLPNTTLAIVSGRDTPELIERIPQAEHYWLGGSHGRTLHPPGSTCKESQKSPRLEPFRTLTLLPGIRREIKAYSVAFHWRGRDGGEPVGWVVEQRESALRQGLEVLDGRMVLEVLLPGTGKEFAIEKIAAACDATAIVFAGDDRTDLEAIQYADSRGIGIFVNSTERSWMAPKGILTLDGPEALATWLHRLADLRESH